MKISIVTINRNNAEGLKRTLDSIAGQLQALGSNHSIEHIIVDGDSNDGFERYLNPALGSTVVSAAPKGVYNAINIGLRKVTGDIVGLLHSGDVFSAPDILAKIAARFEQKDSPDYIWGDVTIGKRYYSGRKFTAKKLLKGFAPPHPSLYIQRVSLEKTGLYDETYTIAGDFDYFVRLSLMREFSSAYLPETVVDMEPGGISQKLYNRMLVNNPERLRALRSNGLPASRLRFMLLYFNALKGFLCSSRKK